MFPQYFGPTPGDERRAMGRYIAYDRDTVEMYKARFSSKVDAIAIEFKKHGREIVELEKRNMNPEESNDIREIGEIIGELADTLERDFAVNTFGDLEDMPNLS
jgi:hypothetical protein